MDKTNFKQLLQEHPECVSNGAKIKAFLKDLYPDVPKAIVNTLTIMANDGIISEMQKAGQSPLVSARLQKKLEDDYGLSQKIISECFSLIIYDSAKQPQTTNNVRSHENINVSAHTTSKSASKKENFPKNTTKSGKKPLPQSILVKGKTTKQTNANFAGDLKDFKIENGTLKKYKGSSSVVVIPDSVTRIGEYAFSVCSALTSVTIPDSVTSIGRSAFYGCNWLMSVTIPDSVMRIGEFAFSGCSALTSITIPDSVTRIGEFAFSGCSALTSITIPDSVTSIGNSAFSGCSALTSITVPDSVTSIEKFSFSCSGLTSVSIPDSVTRIREYAFSGCSALTSITVPDSVTSIGKRAFVGCKGLTSITYKGTMTQWKAISKDIDWNKDVPSSCTIYCADGFCN